MVVLGDDLMSVFVLRLLSLTVVIDVKYVLLLLLLVVVGVLCGYVFASFFVVVWLCKYIYIYANM